MARNRKRGSSDTQELERRRNLLRRNSTAGPNPGHAVLLLENNFSRLLTEANQRILLEPQ